MGMDVVGRNATTEAGKYFRNNVWWWRPLADYCCEVAPKITASCRYWQSNDGDGLNKAESIALANALEVEIKAGRTASYAAIREAEQNALPDERCGFCAGTGTRSDKVARDMGFTERVCEGDDHPRKGQVGWCNACDGRGFNRPSETNYPFSVDNVQEFIEFLRGCGGFKIH